MWLIEVIYRPNFVDALGNIIKKDIKDLAISGVKNVKTAQVYEIEGKITEKELKLLCDELLADKITQQYKIRASSPSPPPSPLWGEEKGEGFIVQVWYKKGVTDAVADTTKKGAVDLGIKGIDTVKTGYEYTIIGNVAKEQIEKICSGLLANKVVQEYIIQNS